MFSIIITTAYFIKIIFVYKFAIIMYFHKQVDISIKMNKHVSKKTFIEASKVVDKPSKIID